MELSFSKHNGEIEPVIDELVKKAGGIHHPALVREMIIAALKAGQETDYLADLKMLNSTIKEMRYTNKVFAPYRQRKKVTIFGSARTDPSEPIYQKCVRFSRQVVGARLYDHNRRWPGDHACRERGGRKRETPLPQISVSPLNRPRTGSC